MYNPVHLNECEKEKKIQRRHVADRIMLIIGVTASFSSLPQVFKIIETSSIEGLSLLTQILALSTVIAWFIYGSYIKNKPLIITTAISVVILATVIIQMIMYQ